MSSISSCVAGRPSVLMLVANWRTYRHAIAATKPRDQLIQLLTRSTVHGISHAASSASRAEQAFWLVLVLMGVTSFIGNLVSVVSRYNKFPVLTAYYTNEEKFIWPDITFCDNAPVIMNSSHAYAAFTEFTQDLLKDPLVNDLADLMDAFFDNSLGNESLAVLIRSIALASINSRVFKVEDPMQIIIELGYKLQNEGIQTQINIDSLWQPFQEEDYMKFFASNTVAMRYRCSCYTLKLNSFISARQLDAIDALQFNIRGNYRTYWRFNSSNNPFGGRVYIHVPNTLPEDGRVLETPPGVITTVVLEQKRHRLIPGKSDCREVEKTAEVFDYDLKHSRLYNLSYFHCHQVLSQEIFYNACSCYNPHLIVPKLSEKQPVLCLNWTTYGRLGVAANLECLSKTAALYRVEANFRPLLRSQCAHLRKKRCNSISWDLDKQRELYREMWAETANEARESFIKAALSMVKGLATETELPQRNASILRQGRLEISNLIVAAAKDQGDLIIEEAEYPLPQLLSDIGGLMGLYLGVSVIGLFEFIAVLVLLMKHWHHECRCEPQRQRRLCDRVFCDDEGRGGTGDSERGSGILADSFAYRCPSRRLQSAAANRSHQQEPARSTSGSCGGDGGGSLSMVRPAKLYSADNFMLVAGLNGLGGGGGGDPTCTQREAPDA